jgi:hypothetical protein
MKDIQTLLKKKKLSGKEAARLIISDNFEYFMSNGAKKILKDGDRETIVESLQGDQDIKDYNAYLHIGKRIQETFVVLDAVKGSIAARLYRVVIEMLKTQSLSEHIRRDAFTPQIMTEKQLEDMKKLQRQNLLDEPVSLAEILVSLADDAYPDISVFYADKEEAKGKADIQEYEDAVDELAKDYPEAYQEGYKRLTELITSGQLAVDIPPKRNLTPRSFSLMKKTFVKREALYRLGYWQEYVDTYHPNLNHETGGTAAGVAIIQDPEPYQLDDKGYYRDTFTLRHLYSPDEITEIKESTWMTVASAADKTKKELRSIYRYTAIIRAYSDLMDYDFRGHMDVILRVLKEAVDFFNLNLKETIINFSPIYPRSEEPYPIDIDSLQPPPEAIEKMRESINIQREPWEELFSILRQEEPVKDEEEYP